MALYSYLCKCGRKQERFISYSRRDEEFLCESCGENCIRVLDLGGVSFKIKGKCSFKPKYKDGSRPKSHVPHMKHDMIDKR